MKKVSQKKNRILLLAFTALLCSFCVSGDVFAGTADVSGTGYTTESNGTYNGNTHAGLANQSISIDIKAKVLGGYELCYDVDLFWGDMKFEYYYGRVWNPKTHTYSNYPEGVTGGEWIPAGPNGVNNRINVTNNSNFPMQADFSFAMNGTSLNDSPTADGSVIGIFSNSNDTLCQLLDQGYQADVPDDPGQAVDKQTDTRIMEMNREKLRSGDKYYYKNYGGEPSVTEYFALSGKPDSNRSRSYTSVGTITVTISPVQDAFLEVTD